MHSGTKYLGGHSDTLSGLLVTSREDLTADLLHIRNATGGVLSAFESYLMLRGIKTLSLRMDKHIANTRELLDFLTSHEQVAWVNHPDLPDHPSHSMAKKYLPKGAGSIVSFGVKGGREAGKAFIENVQLASHLANVGDAKTLIIHPATTTHSRIDAEALVAAGITEDMVRLSVGLEDVEDIKADFQKGFRAARKFAGNS